MKPRHFAARKNFSQPWTWNCPDTSHPPSSSNPPHFIKSKTKTHKTALLSEISQLLLPSALGLGPAPSALPLLCPGSSSALIPVTHLWVPVLFMLSPVSLGQHQQLQQVTHNHSSGPCSLSPTFPSNGDVCHAGYGSAPQRSLPRMAFLPTPRIRVRWLVCLRVFSVYVFVFWREWSMLFL